MTAGEGASFNYADYGQTGNPCGDPPSPAGTNLTPPGAEGGSLRSQSVRRPTGEPVSLDGAVLRLDPATGAASTFNPFAANANPNRRRVVGYGLRNPFRFTFRPGTSEVWIGDVGQGTWEEINRLSSRRLTATNFGWPCYEGAGRNGGFDSANLNQCETLYSAGTATGPYYTYSHSARVVTGESCPTGSSAITGLAFYDRPRMGGNYPTAYEDALFFADHSRNCIWAMRRGSNGLPNPSTIETFVSAAGNPVDLEIGPDGDLYYADLEGGRIHRIRYTSANNAPTARASADPTSGSVPLTVSFDGTASSDPDPGDALSYAWDLDADGAFDDSTSATTSFTYTAPGAYNVRLRVTDNAGAADVASVTVSASDSPPVPVIDSPDATLTWKAGDAIAFSGHASDAEDGTVPASGLRWDVIVHHCPSNCHTHAITSFNGVASGTFTAPDHEYPSYVELRLTATDATGTSASTSVDLQPLTVDLNFQSSPSGLRVSTAYGERTTPFSVAVIAHSSNSITAVAPQSAGGKTYAFASWSDGGAATHQITAADSGSDTYTATFTETAPPPSGLVAAYGFDEGVGSSVADASGSGNGGTISGASWTTGRFGGALSFNGTNNWVTVPDANSLDLTRFTISAWVKPASTQSGWRTVALKEKTNGLAYALYANGVSPSAPAVWIDAGSEVGTGTGASALPAGVWSYVTGTYDGSALRLYVDGVLKATRNTTGTIAATTGPLRIGGNAVWTEWFNGALDEIRIYNRALSAAEINTDRNTPIRQDTDPPSAPTGLTAAGGLGTVALSWNPVTDSSGISGYGVHRSTTSGFTPSTATFVRSVSATSMTDTVTPGTYYYRVIAHDGAGNASHPSAEASATATADTTDPSVSVSSPADAATVSGSVALAATASDNVGVVGVQFNVDGNNVGAEDTTTPYTANWDSTTVAAGQHQITAVARDAAGNTTTSAAVTVTVSAPPPTPSGLVAAYGFDEGVGSSVADASGSGNGGTISGASWTTGRFGGALSFNGTNNWVTVPDANSLDLTRFTISAWVKLASTQSGWRTVALKEKTNGLAYALYANGVSPSAPAVWIDAGSEVGTGTGASALPAGVWSYVTGTYDGSALRLYVDGVLKATRNTTGTIAATTGPLRIGGNAVWTEWFNGALDEIRIYNRALSAAEINTDRNTPIS